MTVRALSIAALLLPLAFTSCLTVHKSPMHVPFEQPPGEAPKDYREAVEALDGVTTPEVTEKSLQTLDAYMRQNPASPYTQSALFNSGRALEALGRYSEAAERYRKVFATTDKSAPRLQALSLYRLSFCTEALGDDQATVAVLHDLLSRRKQLPAEVADAELPARLAGAYARTGVFESAVRYYRQAEAGIARLRSASKDGEVPEWLPRTLYFMGTRPLTHLGWSDFENAFRPMARGQIYLLEASDLNVEPWSNKSADNLIALYQELYTSLQGFPTNPAADPLIEQRAAQGLQWQRAALLLDSLQELTARAAPGEQTASSKRILDFAGDLRGKIETLLATRPAGEGLTKEAINRQSAVRGRVVAPNDELERQFVDSARALPSKKTPAKPAPNDPNL